MIVNRLADALRKNGRPVGMSPGIRGHGYGPRLESFPVRRLRTTWTRPAVYGPRAKPIEGADLCCLTCGRTVPDPSTHGVGEEWRDAEHQVRAYGVDE